MPQIRSFELRVLSRHFFVTAFLFVNLYYNLYYNLISERKMAQDDSGNAVGVPRKNMRIL